MTAVLLPSLVLHTVAFLLQLPLPTLVASQTTEPPEQQGCSSPKACGSLNISYPFWLEEPGQPPCGSPSFQLKCNSSGAFLSRSMFQAYRVVNIFYQNSSLHVVDENLPLAAGCPAPCFNLSLSMGFMPAFTKAELQSNTRRFSLQFEYRKHESQQLQGSSEGLKAEEIKHVDSNVI
ncbi:LEAF RUST 10 DISEASE-RESISTANCEUS RECEPTOR-LIKE PROTEIN KINASE-like 1.2 [Miscanthus floridulus]|uniref:LEAF RUST 10 DISEASE-RESISTANCEUS RECEPTOR-LIKE PROTEIN KINASE-like 1.2 n=1 Tax=Miscanthus floridulus TaxID=154761 RepID=UPI0034590A11